MMKIALLLNVLLCAVSVACAAPTAGYGSASAIFALRSVVPLSLRRRMQRARASRPILEMSVNAAQSGAAREEGRSLVQGSSPWKPMQNSGKVAPKLIDATLAGIGLCTAISVLCALQPILGVKLFAAPMMASGIIFFAARKPPSPMGFLVGTAAAATICELAFLTLPSVVKFGTAAGVLLMVYKLSNNVFPPAAVLSVLIGQAVSEAKAAGLLATSAEVVKFAAFPWLVGHFFLYVAAVAIGKLRGIAQNWAIKSQLRGLASDMSLERMKQVFEQFDTSGDGFLDAEELKVALRVARGADVSLDDCKALIRSVDTDGDGVIDVKEFCEICSDD